jgi:hypothetical protein
LDLDTFFYPDTHRDGDADGYIDANRDFHGHAHPDIDSKPDSHLYPDPQRDAFADGDTDSGAGWKFRGDRRGL